MLNIFNNVYPITLNNGFNGLHFAAGREYFVRTEQRSSCRPAARADPEELKRMRNLSKTFFLREPVDVLELAVVENFNAFARPANDVVVVIMAMSQLVAGRAVAELAAAKKAGLLEAREAPVDRHDRKPFRGALGSFGVNLLGGERPVVAQKRAQDRLARLGDFQSRLAKTVEDFLKTCVFRIF